MKRREMLGLLCASLVVPACADPGGSSAPSGSSAPASTAGAVRLVVAGGTLAEIAFAVGAGGDVVGVDTSCTYPEATQKLPQVGYQRKLSAEGVLSLRPTILLAGNEAGPPEVLTQIEGAGVRVVRFDGAQSIEAAIARIRAVGTAVGRSAEGERLATEVSRDVAAAREEIGRTTERPRALFIYARGPGTAMVGGKGTSAASMIELAGGVNAAREFDGFKPITAESVIAARPDVIVMPGKGLESLGGADALFALPGLAATPAAAAKRVTVLDDLLLLGFGPRLGEALRTLSRGLRAPALPAR